MRRTILCWILLALVAAAGGALAREGRTPLAALSFRAPELDPTPRLRALAELPSAERQARARELQRIDVRPSAALFDLATGRLASMRPAVPLLPGRGRGNQLTWSPGERPDGAEALEAEAWRRLEEYLFRRHGAGLGVRAEELIPRGAVLEGGDLIQFSAGRRFGGLPVRGAHLSAVIRFGNLVLLGTSRWFDIEVDLGPSLPASSAVDVVAEFTAPHSAIGEGEAPTLVLAPVRTEQGTIGHRLAWVVTPRFAGDPGRWEALVDAHDGELLAFEDRNHYGEARNVKGGVYPASTDGVPPDGSMVPGYPMPYTDLESGGFTDAGGNFAAAGPVSTTLTGQFVTIADGCGSILEFSDSGDIDLEGSDGDTDCDVPPGHSDGDTAGARTAFYELNRIREMAAGQLPGNVWLSSPLPANTNIDATCGAFWNGTSVNFFRNSGSQCENPAQIAGVVDHEWAHGMDDNDVSGSIPSIAQGGGEGYGDLLAAFRGNISCIGRGFFVNGTGCGGYGDPCTPESGCTGVRTVDYADRTSGEPHDLTWVRAFCVNDSPQCVGAAYSEAVWDLAKRDLPAIYGMRDDTARELVTRLLFVAGGNLTGWFDLDGPAPGDAGCGAGQAYLQFLAVDDDDGDIDNGTPHMTAIAAAFDRLEIGCTPGGATPGPIVQDSGCSPTPTVAPAVTAMATDMGADLAWDSVADAAEYKVYRTDGERLCDLGKALVGATTGLAFSDSGLQNGRPYSYVVIPFGAGGDSCFGPASDCVTVGGPALIFADGFESGDTAAWSATIP